MTVGMEGSLHEQIRKAGACPDHEAHVHPRNARGAPSVSASDRGELPTKSSSLMASTAVAGGFSDTRRHMSAWVSRTELSAFTLEHGDLALFIPEAPLLAKHFRRHIPEKYPRALAAQISP